MSTPLTPTEQESLNLLRAEARGKAWHLADGIVLPPFTMSADDILRESSAVSLSPHSQIVPGQVNLHRAYGEMAAGEEDEGEYGVEQGLKRAVPPVDEECYDGDGESETGYSLSSRTPGSSAAGYAYTQELASASHSRVDGAPTEPPSLSSQVSSMDAYSIEDFLSRSLELSGSPQLNDASHSTQSSLYEVPTVQPSNHLTPALTTPHQPLPTFSVSAHRGAEEALHARFTSLSSCILPVPASSPEVLQVPAVAEGSLSLQPGIDSPSDRVGVGRADGHESSRHRQRRPRDRCSEGDETAVKRARLTPVTTEGHITVHSQNVPTSTHGEIYCSRGEPSSFSHDVSTSRDTPMERFVPMSCRATNIGATADRSSRVISTDEVVLPLGREMEDESSIEKNQQEHSVPLMGVDNLDVERDPEHVEDDAFVDDSEASADDIIDVSEESLRRRPIEHLWNVFGGESRSGSGGESQSGSIGVRERLHTVHELDEESGDQRVPSDESPDYSRPRILASCAEDDAVVPWYFVEE